MGVLQKKTHEPRWHRPHVIANKGTNMSWLSWCKWDSPYTSFPFRGFSNITSCGKLVIAALNYVTKFRCFSVDLENSWVPFRIPLKWHSLQLTMIMIWTRWSPFPDAPKTSSCFSCFVLPHGQISPEFNFGSPSPVGPLFSSPNVCWSNPDVRVGFSDMSLLKPSLRLGLKFSLHLRKRLFFALEAANPLAVLTKDQATNSGS